MFSRRPTTLLLLLAGALCFHLATLSSYPSVFVDEVWLISRAWAWLRTGVNFGPLDAGVFDKQLDGYGTFFPIIPTLLISVFVYAFGLAMPWLRLLPLVFGFGLLMASFFVAYECSGSKRCGLIAALLVVTSHSFLISAHLVRYDIFVAALGYGALAVAIAGWDSRRPTLLFLAGVLVTLAFEAHMNAVVFGPMILTMLLRQGGWRAIWNTRLFALFFGVLCGFGIYALVHIFPDPRTFLVMGEAMAASHLPPVISSCVECLWTSVGEIANYWIFLTAGRILVVVLIAVTLYRSSFQSARILFLALLAGLLTFSLLIKNKMFYYAILLAPMADILLAVWIQEMTAPNVQLTFWSKRIKAVTISTVIGTCGIPVYLALSSPFSGDLELVTNRVQQVVSANASIMATQTYWLKLNAHPYLSWQQLLVYGRLNGNYSIGEALNALRPDILIIDDDLQQYIIPSQNDAPRSSFERYLWERRLPKEELDSFLMRQGHLLDSFVNPTYGKIQVYSIDWNVRQ
jgi:hypothetical protein